MDEVVKQRLIDYGIYILPDTLEAEMLPEWWDVILSMRGKPLTLICTGLGGDTDVALTIIDHIQQHGNVTGLIYGSANSSHGSVWIACQHRYVAPHASLGLHMVAFGSFGDTQIDERLARSRHQQLDRIDRMLIQIFADNTGHAYAWWEKYIKTNSVTVEVMDGQTLIDEGIARPVSEFIFPPPVPLHLDRDEGEDEDEGEGEAGDGLVEQVILELPLNAETERRLKELFAAGKS